MGVQCVKAAALSSSSSKPLPSSPLTGWRWTGSQRSASPWATTPFGHPGGAGRCWFWSGRCASWWLQCLCWGLERTSTVSPDFCAARALLLTTGALWLRGFRWASRYRSFQPALCMDTWSTWPGNRPGGEPLCVTSCTVSMFLPTTSLGAPWWWSQT